MAEENIMFFENDDKSYIIVDQDINSNRYLEKFINSYNYYDIDVDKISLFKKSDNEYIIRYNNVNKMMTVPLQLKINNFYNELNACANNNRVIFIYNDDKEFFRKCIEIWNKIIEVIGTNNPLNFVETDDHDQLFITADVHKNTSFVIEDNYRYGHNNVVIVLHSIINDCYKTSLVQHRY